MDDQGSNAGKIPPSESKNNDTSTTEKQGAVLHIFDTAQPLYIPSPEEAKENSLLINQHENTNLNFSSENLTDHSVTATGGTEYIPNVLIAPSINFGEPHSPYEPQEILQAHDVINNFNAVGENHDVINLEALFNAFPETQHLDQAQRAELVGFSGNQLVAHLDGNIDSPPTVIAIVNVALGQTVSELDVNLHILL